MSYLVLARKWRPQTFDDLTGQESIARILKNAISLNKTAHAYIFSGPRGVGKTTTARILAKALNCLNGPTTEPCGTCPSCTTISEGSSMDVSEIDGASNTGVDNIRDLRERVRYAPSGGKYKVYIIDEAHMLSTSAFNALLKTLEEPPPHVIFVLATTEPKRIPATVLSRCQHLPFRRISGQKIKERLRFITGQEGIRITEPALEMIARAADGSMRDSLTLLDQVTSFAEDVSVEEIRDLLGITDVQTLHQLASAVIEGDRKRIVEVIAGLTEAGTDLKAFTRDLLQFIRNLLIAVIVGDTTGVMELSEEEAKAIGEIKGTTSEEHLAVLLSELIKAEPGIRSSFFPRVALEMSLIRLSLLSHLQSIDEALRLLPDGPAEPQRGSAAARKSGRETTGQTERTAEQQKEKSPPARKGGRTKGEVLEKPKVMPQDEVPVEEPVIEVETEETDYAPYLEPHASPSSGQLRVAEELEQVPVQRSQPLSVSEVWTETLRRIEEVNHPLCFKLQEGEAIFEQDGIRIIFSGGHAFHAESVKESLPVVQKVLREVAGKELSLAVDTNDGKKRVSKKDLKAKAMQNPLIREALELFEARVVDVIPGKEGTAPAEE